MFLHIIKVGKALSNYSSNTLLDKLLLFELTVFCFLTGNSDMHLKNFSMIESTSGWILSPAYDLLQEPGTRNQEPNRNFPLT